MELLELLELKPGCSPLCAMQILRKYSSMHRRGTGELHCTESSYHPAEQHLLATSERLAIKVQRIVIDQQHFMSKRNNQSYRLFNLPPHEPTAWAVALLRVDPTRGSETGTVRGERPLTPSCPPSPGLAYPHLPYTPLPFPPEGVPTQPGHRRFRRQRVQGKGKGNWREAK